MKNPTKTFFLWRKLAVRKLLFFLLIFLSLCISAQAADTDFSLSQPDKRLHFYGSAYGAFGLSMLGTAITNNKTLGPILGTTAMIALGALKESTDRTFSIGDLKADVLGSLLGGLFTFTIVRL